MHKSLLYLTMIGFLLLGSAVTIFLKLQDSLFTTLSDGTSRQWHHPFVQTAMMFVGELACGLIYIFYFKSRVPASSKPKLSPYLYLFPTLFDILASSCLFIGLT